MALSIFHGNFVLEADYDVILSLALYRIVINNEEYILF